MYKTCLPMLAVAALAGGAAIDARAQSSIEVYGLVGAYAGKMQRSGDAAAVRQVNGGGLTTSFLGFRGKEDLGGDLKAIYALESFFRPDTGEQGRSAADPLFSRNAWVGLEGSWGRLTLGRQTNPAYAAMAQLSPLRIVGGVLAAGVADLCRHLWQQCAGRHGVEQRRAIYDAHRQRLSRHGAIRPGRGGRPCRGGQSRPAWRLQPAAHSWRRCRRNG